MDAEDQGALRTTRSNQHEPTASCLPSAAGDGTPGTVGRIMRAPPLETFTKAMLEEYKFPGTDAAVVFVPDGQSPPPEVANVLKRSAQQRWFPVPGGHDVKVPWHFSKGFESLFNREKKGWDHEHCDCCNEHVYIGELCWTADSDRGIWIFCQECYKKVRE